MTFSRCATLARQWSRVDDGAFSDAEVYTQINEALRQFAVDVFGLRWKDNPPSAARFDMRTVMAFHLEMTDGTLGNVDTDIAVTDSNADDQTGAQAATELQSQIQAAGNAAAGLTVTWSAANNKFTIGNIAATTTAISIEGPDANNYMDATDKFFGGTFDENDQSGTSIVCSFPEGCTIVASLPTNTGTIHKVDAVYWDDYELTEVQPADVRWGEAQGEPRWYSRRGENILLYPAPTEQEECMIYFRGIPADLAEAAGTSITTVPERYQQAIPRLVACWLLEGVYEEQRAKIQEKKYLWWKNKYINDYSGHVKKNGRRPATSLWYKVNV